MIISTVSRLNRYYIDEENALITYPALLRSRAIPASTYSPGVRMQSTPSSKIVFRKPIALVRCFMACKKKSV